MYRTTLLLAAQQGDSSLLRSKLRTLSRVIASPCHIIIHGNSPPLQRFYLFEDDVLTAAAEAYKGAVCTWAESLIAPLSTGKVSFTLEYVWSKHLDLQQHLKETECDLVAVYCGGNRPSSQFRRVIEGSHCPVLLLSNHGWRSQLSLLAGIDPFHKSDRSANMDIKVVNHALALNRALKGDLSVVHSCYVPGYMVKYRTMIHSTHQRVIQEFIANNGWHKLNWRLLQGEPSDALAHYCRTHHIDILIMGLVARGVLKRQITGSTSEQLMEALCCDLLLVPKGAP